MKWTKMSEELREARKEAIDESDKKLVEHVRKHIGEYKDKPLAREKKPNTAFLLASIIILGLLLCGLTYLLATALIQPKTIKVVEYKTQVVEKIVEKQPIINKEVNNNYIQPENTANCLKVEQMIDGKPTGKFSMSCEVVE